MSANVRVIAGPARCGKTGQLVARYREALARSPIGSALWLAPASRAAQQVRADLVGGGGARVLAPGVLTFQRFAKQILDESDKPIRPLGPLLKRRLIERVLGELSAAGKLGHFGPIAETAGLVDLVGGLIADLKRQEIWPDEFERKIAALDGSPKNRELAAIYRAYQRLLDQHTLYDAEGRYWWARELLRQGHWGPFATARFVVVDGFTDFTPIQHDILTLLATRADEVSITLPLEQEAGREDLFRKSRETLAVLDERYPGLRVEWAGRRAAGDWPTMDHVERHLFRNPRELVPAAETRRVEVLAASGQLSELQAIARRIKRLLVEGDPDGGAIRPGDVCVVLRSLDSAALVQEVFDEYGLPVAIDFRPRLNRSPALAALMGVLRLEVENWPYRQLLAVLTNNFFRPRWPEWNGGEAAPAVEWVVRQLQIPRDRRELLKAVEARAKTPEAEGDAGRSDDALRAARKREQRERFKAAAGVLGQLWRALSALERPRTTSQWIAALQDLANEIGLFADGGADSEAWDALVAVLKADEQLETWLDAKPAAMPLAQLTRRMLEILSVEPLPGQVDEVGRVRVLAAQSVRALDVPCLFVAGLSEKSFPPAARDDRIYSEAECRGLNEAGLHVVDQQERRSEEMLLFYEVVTRASRRLVLSYPALDDEAQPLLPSPYLIELERCVGSELSRTVEISLSPVPQGEAVYSPAERRVKAVAELPRDPQRFARLQGGAGSPAIANGLQAILTRAHRDEFGPFEGILAGEPAKSRLGKRYGAEHCWSVSRLEDYAFCPFRFFMSSVLGLERLPELSLAVDYADRGWLAHEALAALHRRLNETDGPRSPVALGKQKCSTLTSDTLAVLFERVMPGSPLERALREVNIRQVSRWMTEYFGQHERYEAKSGEEAELRPAHFEVSFGLKLSGDGDDPLSTEKPFELKCGDETLKLSGRIDRIDVGLVGGQVVFNVVDYKTGNKLRLKQEDIDAGRALQLPLYAMAVQELLMIDRCAMPWRVGYWYLRKEGFEAHSLPQLCDHDGASLAETDAWRDLRGSLLARVASLVRGVRSGMFPVYSLDDACTGWCAYRTACRVGQIRSLEKTWKAPQ